MRFDRLLEEDDDMLKSLYCRCKRMFLSMFKEDYIDGVNPNSSKKIIMAFSLRKLSEDEGWIHHIDSSGDPTTAKFFKLHFSSLEELNIKLDLMGY